MFVHLAVHHPKPEYSDDLLASMHRVDQAAQGAPGLIQIGAWRDERSDRLIGLAQWESQEAFVALPAREGRPWRLRELRLSLRSLLLARFQRSASLAAPPTAAG